MAVALIMAGGSSRRMRASLGRRHKALVTVQGVAMLERNILALIAHGLREIVVAISWKEKALLSFAQGRASRLARAAGATLQVFVERRPLGTIGAARAIPPSAGNVLVVNVDNLTCLDLSALLVHHDATGAAMTVATHDERFPIPFGQVSIEEGRIIDYKEKPVFAVPLSSGIYVLSPLARQSIPPGPLGAPELVHILLRDGRRVSAFSHCAPWIDINESASLERAEALVRENFRCFEIWGQPPDRESVILCILKGRLVLTLKTNGARPSAAKRILPMEDNPAEAGGPVGAGSRLQHRIGLPVSPAELLASFDELDTRTGQRTRYHLVLCTLAAAKSAASLTSRNKWRWVDVNQLPNFNGKRRAVAYLNGHLFRNSHPHHGRLRNCGIVSKAAQNHAS
jgi:NDP-mannose synthase